MSKILTPEPRRDDKNVPWCDRRNCPSWTQSEKLGRFHSHCTATGVCVPQVRLDEAEIARLHTALNVLEISYKAMQCEYYETKCDLGACDTCGWNNGKICTNPEPFGETTRWKPQEAAEAANK